MPAFDDTQNVQARVMEVTQEVLGVSSSELGIQSDIRKDLGADSLDMMSLIWALEEEFNGKIDDSDARGLTTPESIVRYIESKLKAA